MMPHREQAVGKTDEWYTPPRLFNAMGVVFDLDVAHPGLDIVDWIPANQIITHNSLSSKWGGFVWCNPPFGGRNGLDPWLSKFFDHGDGVILTPDRTSAPWWQKHAPKADAILFVSPRVRFIPKEGKTSSPAQGTTLMASGEKGVNALRNAQQNGLGWMVTVRAAALKETGGE